MKNSNYFMIGALAAVLACQQPDDSVNPGNETHVDTLIVGMPTPVGNPIGVPTTKVIGPAGGTLRTDDGKFAIDFPAGAVTKETTITLQPGVNNAPNGVGMGFNISPANLTFEKPITITYYYTDDEMSGASMDALGLAYQDVKGVWQQNQTVKVNKEKKTITAKAKGPDWMALIGNYMIEPENDTVFVGETREIQLKKTGKIFSEEGDAPIPLLLQDAGHDIAKLSINGIDWTNSTPGDQRWGGVSRDPHTAKILYVSPSKKPKTKNPVMIGVEIKNPYSSAKFILYSRMYIRADNSLIIDGHSFDDITVNGSVIAERMFIAAAGTDSTGKYGKIAIFLNGLSVGSHPFSKDPANGTYINVVNEAGKKDRLEGSSYYATCQIPETESGAVHVLKVETINGYAKAIIEVSGKVVIEHEVTDCQVTSHKTMSVNGVFTILARK